MDRYSTFYDPRYNRLKLSWAYSGFIVTRGLNEILNLKTGNLVKNGRGRSSRWKDFWPVAGSPFDAFVEYVSCGIKKKMGAGWTPFLEQIEDSVFYYEPKGHSWVIGEVGTGPALIGADWIEEAGQPLLADVLRYLCDKIDRDDRGAMTGGIPGRVSG